MKKFLPVGALAFKPRLMISLLAVALMLALATAGAAGAAVRSGQVSDPKERRSGVV